MLGRHYQCFAGLKTANIRGSIVHFGAPVGLNRNAKANARRMVCRKATAGGRKLA